MILFICSVTPPFHKCMLVTQFLSNNMPNNNIICCIDAIIALATAIFHNNKQFRLQMTLETITRH